MGGSCGRAFPKGAFLGAVFLFPFVFFGGFFCSFPHGGLSKQAAEAADGDSSRRGGEVVTAESGQRHQPGL